jgi:hypothetical protein
MHTFFFHGAGVWTQGLHLEPLHQLLFVVDYFQDRVSGTVCMGWLWTMILLISASWVVRITAFSHSAQGMHTYMYLHTYVERYTCEYKYVRVQIHFIFLKTTDSSSPLSFKKSKLKNTIEDNININQKTSEK